jgi:hypothetical protein
MFRKLFLASLLLIISSCGKLESPTSAGGSTDPIDPTATFTRVKNEIFTPTCAQLGCHGTIGTQENLVLTPGVAYSNIVGVSSIEMPQLARVTPGDPNNSYLYRKVTGAGITGAQMPNGLTPLNDAQLKLIRDWIRRGAPND